MKVCALAFLICATAFACGGENESSGPSEADVLCEALDKKVVECGLGTAVNCGVGEACMRCAVDADCAQISGAVEGNPYYACLAECSGASLDDFICADGSGFVSRRGDADGGPGGGVCDGIPQCPDGSDEATCS